MKHFKISSPRPSLPSNYEYACPGCGFAYISNSSNCPNCGSLGKSGSEMTKKVMDEPDLKKGGC